MTSKGISLIVGDILQSRKAMADLEAAISDTAADNASIDTAGNASIDTSGNTSIDTPGNASIGNTSIDAPGNTSIDAATATTTRETKVKTISTRTAQRWLAKMGWVYSQNRKGYVDGHEREDVVQYRNETFIPRVMAVKPLLREYIDEVELEKDVLDQPDPRRRVLVTHDESTFNANDGKTHSWKPAGKQWLAAKSKGKGLMVSDFLTAAQGRLAYIDPATNTRDLACEIIKYGSGKYDEGWWNSAKMVEQVSPLMT